MNGGIPQSWHDGSTTNHPTKGNPMEIEKELARLDARINAQRFALRTLLIRYPDVLQSLRDDLDKTGHEWPGDEAYKHLRQELIALSTGGSTPPTT